MRRGTAGARAAHGPRSVRGSAGPAARGRRVARAAGQGNLDDVDPIEEVLTEEVSLDPLLQVPVRRRNDRTSTFTVRWSRAARTCPPGARAEAWPGRGGAARPSRRENRAAVGRLEAAVRFFSAPVKAPRSCPNSSASRRVSVSAPQLTATNGRGPGALRSCSMRATSSLPVPLSPGPGLATRRSPRATTLSRTRLSAGDWPTITVSGERPASVARACSSSSSSARLLGDVAEPEKQFIQFERLGEIVVGPFLQGGHA